MKQYQRDLLATLVARVKEPRKFIQVLVGPRQVGKTTLINQLLAQKQIFARNYMVDEVVAPTGQWLDLVWEQLRQEMVLQGEKTALLVIDEIQKIKDWSRVVKHNWEKDTQNGRDIKVILSGSSRLMLQEGLSESLMGRFELLKASHWSYREMKAAFGFSPEQYAWFGGYPGAASLIQDEQRFKTYVRDAIVEAGLNRDILMLTRVDKPALLRQLLDFSLTYNSQLFSFNKMLGQLFDAGNTTTLAHYLNLLSQSLLITGLDGYSKKLIKVKASSPKLQAYNMALVSAMSQLTFEEAQRDLTAWGRIVEGAVGAHILNVVSKNPALKLFYWRDNDLELDFVLQYGDKILGIEVKSSAIEPNYKAIESFKKHFPKARVLVVGGGHYSWQEMVAQDNWQKWFEVHD